MHRSSCSQPFIFPEISSTRRRREARRNHMTTTQAHIREREGDRRETGRKGGEGEREEERGREGEETPERTAVYDAGGA